MALTTAFSIEASRSGATAFAVVYGDLDVRGGRQLLQVVTRQVDGGSTTIAVDLVGCTSVDEHGLRALWQVRTLARQRGSVARFRCADPALAEAIDRGGRG